MKKIAILSALLLAVSGSAFAQQLGNTDTLDVEPSNGVTIVYGADTTNTGETFTLVTYHDKGTKSYMSSSEDAVIYWGDGQVTTAPTAPTAGTSVGETSSFPNTL